MNRDRLFCGFCDSSKESKITGPLLNKDDVVAHRNCLFYSSNIVNKNTPDYDDLIGFLPEDVKEEIRRGSRLKCARCRKSGATVGCEVKRCKRSYHYPCAVQDNAENIEDEDNGIFKIYCKLHKENSDTQKEEMDESEGVVKRKRPRPSSWAAARRIRDDDCSDTDDSQNGIDPELAPLESDLEDSRELRPNSPIPDQPGRDVSDEPKPSTSGTFRHGDAGPSAVSEDKADTGSDRQGRADRTKLGKNREPKDLVHHHNGDADETDVDSDQESQSILVPLKITQLVPINPDNSASLSSTEPGAGDTAKAVEFWRRCREAGCVETIFHTFISAMNGISERVLSEHASEKDCALSLRVLEASGMLPEIFEQKDREYDNRLLSLQREMEVVRKTRSAVKSAAQMKNLN